MSCSTPASPGTSSGQIAPGSAVTDKVVELSPFGIDTSVGTLQFVPDGFPGAGALKIVSFTTGSWSDATLVFDGTGLYDLTNVTEALTLTGGPEGVVYVPLGSPEVRQRERGRVRVPRQPGVPPTRWTSAGTRSPPPNRRW